MAPYGVGEHLGRSAPVLESCSLEFFPSRIAKDQSPQARSVGENIEDKPIMSKRLPAEPNPKMGLGKDQETTFDVTGTGISRAPTTDYTDET